MIHRIGLFLSALFIACLIALACSSCLLRPKTPPKEALGNLVKTYLDDSQRLLEIGSPLAYSILEPLMLLDGERAAVLILAPVKNVSSYGSMSRETGVITEQLSSAPDIQSPARALSERLDTTAKGYRLNLARGNRIAVMYVTSSMDEHLNESRHVFASDDYLISEEGFQKRFGKKPRAAYSVKYAQPGEWRVMPTSGKELRLTDEEIDAYIQKNGAPWEFSKFGDGKHHYKDSMTFYQVKIYGIHHKVVPPGDVIMENKKEVVGVFARPAIRGNSFIDGDSAIELLSGILPQMPNMTEGEDALHQMVPGNW